MLLIVAVSNVFVVTRRFVVSNFRVPTLVHSDNALRCCC